jgi:hypothetical protein
VHLYGTVCKANSFHGWFKYGQRQETLNRVLAFEISAWSAVIVIGSALMVYFDRLVFGALLWMYGIINSSIAGYITWRCLSLMIENFATQNERISLPIIRDRLSLRKSHSPHVSDPVDGDTRMLKERQSIVLKMRLGILLAVIVWSYCVGGTIYHFTVGRSLGLKDLLYADPEIYSVSPILFLVGTCMGFVCIGSLVVLGNIFGCSQADEGTAEITAPKKGSSNGTGV